MVRTVDRYLFVQSARRYLAVVAVVVTLLMLENAHRLAADLVETTAPLRLLGRLSLLLAPEHLAIANPVALFLGVALTARALTLRGEWQIFAASGMSPARTLLAPMLLAMLATGIQLADRMDWRPGGERGLDALYREIATGEHGTPVRTREPLSLAPGVTMVAEGASRSGGSIVLERVVVHQNGDILYAPRAAVLSMARGGVVLDLQGGTAMHSIGPDNWRRVGFAHLHVGGTPPGLGLIAGNTRQQLDRLSLPDLLEQVTDGPVRDRAGAAIMARIESALFLLLLPWLGMTLGAPPLRRHGGAGLALGILLIVAHQQLAAAIEDNLASVAVATTFAHLTLWLGIAAAAAPVLAMAGRGVERLRALRMPRWGVQSGQRREAEADQILQPDRHIGHATADIGHRFADRRLASA